MKAESRLLDLYPTLSEAQSALQMASLGLMSKSSHVIRDLLFYFSFHSKCWLSNPTVYEILFWTVKSEEAVSMCDHFWSIQNRQCNSHIHFTKQSVKVRQDLNFLSRVQIVGTIEWNTMNAFKETESVHRYPHWYNSLLWDYNDMGRTQSSWRNIRKAMGYRRNPWRKVFSLSLSVTTKTLEVARQHAVWPILFEAQWPLYLTLSWLSTALLMGHTLSCLLQSSRTSRGV